MIEITTFYEFRNYDDITDLESIRVQLKEAMREHLIKGTIILAIEGFNATICGEQAAVSLFVSKAESILRTRIVRKSSFHAEMPFRKIDVKIKPEIVTLKQPVEMANAAGTHVDAEQWNELIRDPEVLLLDARNDYEFKNGTFEGAINPGTGNFSDLPAFVAENLDPKKHKKIAMFCTGGIRCEKFAPYLKGLGFEKVYQLQGGILKYLEETPHDETLWNGECFVFDDRRTVDENLEKGSGPDYSQAKKSY